MNTYLLYPGGKPKALSFSYDDGVRDDIRLVEIFKSHGLFGTFNVNSGLFAHGVTAYPSKRSKNSISPRDRSLPAMR